MAKCDFPDCNNAEPYPFKCSYCEKWHCTQHRLPENHNCEKIHIVKLKKQISTQPIPVQEKPKKRKEKWFKRHEKKLSTRKTDESDIEEEFLPFYSKDKSNEVFIAKPRDQYTRDKLYVAKIGDSFTTGKESIDILIAILLINLSFGFTAMFMSRLQLIFLPFVLSIITLSYLVTFLPEKYLARYLGYNSRYILTKLGLILTAVLIISPFKFINPGTLIIPELSFMKKKYSGILCAIGPIINLFLGIIYLTLGWVLNNDDIRILFVNGAFLCSQFCLWSLIPIKYFSGRMIFDWSKIIYIVIVIFTLGLFICSILLGVMGFIVINP